MRITEIESQIETEKKGALVTLLNMLKTKADRRDTGSKISVDSLNKLMSNLGYNIGYAELDSLVKNNNTIRNLVADYNEEFVTLATAIPLIKITIKINLVIKTLSSKWQNVLLNVEINCDSIVYKL